MERAKTAPAPEEATDNSKSITAPPLQDDDASPEQRVQDLERRLNDLGGDDSAVNVVDNAEIPAKQQPAAVVSQTGKNNPLLVSLFKLPPACIKIHLVIHDTNTQSHPMY